MDELTRMLFRLGRHFGGQLDAAASLFAMRSSLLSYNATEPVIDRAKVIRLGWCLKESDHLKVFRRRWLVLSRQKLCTFKLDGGDYTQPTSSIDMSNAVCSATSSTTIVVRELANKGSSHESPLKVLCLRFSDGVECRAWLTVLHECISAQDAPRANQVAMWESLYHTKD
ncbi:hypothetical protein T492DRAFT_980468 [Pavlovales sp. CCMP2436]|nr:hypothetical protein T492DRAFT_980468 [Pavlovales sp. CCMP2436]